MQPVIVFFNTVSIHTQTHIVLLYSMYCNTSLKANPAPLCPSFNISSSIIHPINRHLN